MSFVDEFAAGAAVSKSEPHFFFKGVSGVVSGWASVFGCVFDAHQKEGPTSVGDCAKYIQQLSHRFIRPRHLVGVMSESLLPLKILATGIGNDQSLEFVCEKKGPSGFGVQGVVPEIETSDGRPNYLHLHVDLKHNGSTPRGDLIIDGTMLFFLHSKSDPRPLGHVEYRLAFTDDGTKKGESKPDSNLSVSGAF